MLYITGYLLLINILAFTIYGIDKRKSIKGAWRISEATLIGVAIIGGGIGSLIAMSLFRHKTQKFKFKFGVPFFTLLSFIGLYFIYDLLN